MQIYNNQTANNDIINNNCIIIMILGAIEIPQVFKDIIAASKELFDLIHDSSKHKKHILGIIKVPAIINKLNSKHVAYYDGESKINFVVRRHYKAIYDMCTSDGHVIVGTPGISKSVSLYYPLLAHFFNYKNPEEAPPVLLHTVIDNYCLLFENGKCFVKCLC